MPQDNAAAQAAPGETKSAPAVETPGLSGGEGLPSVSPADIARHAGLPEEVVNVIAPKEETKPSAPAKEEPVKQESEAGEPEPGTVEEQEPVEPVDAEAEADAEVSEATAEEEPAKGEDEETEPAVDKQPNWYQKRLAKWNRQKQRMQDEIEDLKEQSSSKAKEQEQMPAEPVPPGGDPMAKIQTLEELQYAVNRQRQIRNWCLKNPDGAVFNEGKENETVVTPQEVRDTLVAATEVIENGPRRAEEIRTQAGMRQLVSTEWPELFDKNTEAYQHAQAFLQNNPAIAQSPNRDLILGLMLEGWKPFQARMLARQNGSQAPAKGRDIPEALTRKQPPIPKTTAPNPPRSSARKSPVNDAAAAVNRVIESGATPESVQDAIAAIEKQNAVLGGTKRTAAPV